MSSLSRLGKYEIIEVLGEGAMGVVYKGFDPDIRRPVALKTIRRQLIDGSDFAATIAARFRNEAQSAGRLAHPGIVGVYEYGEDQQVNYIAMEFVEGQSIAHYLSSQVRFTDEDIAGLMVQLLDALDHAHAQGVCHRDIKPANVILSQGGTLKIADFGIARLDDGGLTQTTMMIGTPSYMAPEQFLGLPIDARADLYSAGVLLYVLLVGRPPFSGTQESLMYKVVHETPVVPSQVQGVVRPHFYDAIVATALAKKAEDRYPNARAFKQALVQAIGQPIDATACEKTIIRAPARAPTPPPKRLAAEDASGSIGTATASRWNKEMLTKAEHTLANYIGPMATVLVRRAARECDSEATLYARLAEQVIDPGARQAFLGQVISTGTTGAGTRSGTSTMSSPAGFSDALLESAQQLLTREVGPIAKIVVKKAAAATRDRTALFERICGAVSDPSARARLLTALHKLP